MTPEKVWKLYQSGVDFNLKLNLYDTIEANENFFIGKQWEGVEANGLPTPVFNFLKRVILFQVASITTDNIKLNSAPMGNNPDKPLVRKITEVVNTEFDVLFEKNKIVSKMREYARNAAIDGDGCTYSYWDADADRGHGEKGAIVTEILDNSRVFFGDPNSRDVQRQPWIIIEKREFVDRLREQFGGKGGTSETGDGNTASAAARDGKGKKDPEEILPDNLYQGNNRFDVDGKATVLLYLYKKDNHVFAYECTHNFELREEWDTGLTLYPITWLCWDYIKDCYHGQAMITGLIPNQIFVNKAYALSMLSLMNSAYPKILYDAGRIKSWDNRIGGSIGVNGGDLTNAAKILEPAQISPQVSQFIDKAIDHTQTFLGATNAALGDMRPDNASAIIALQKASSVPSEITQQNLYQSVEDLGRIYLDLMAAYYGTRQIDVPVPDDIPDELRQFAGMDKSETMTVEFDFSILKEMPMTIKLDVGASSYWSEITAIQTLDNLFQSGAIDIVDYLERVPSGYITDRDTLLAKYRRKQAAAESAPQQAADKTQFPITAESLQLQQKSAGDALENTAGVYAM